MKPLTISDKENRITTLREEIRRNATSRYDHRLHGVLLVAQGMTCPQVAQLFGDSGRAVVNWVQRFEAQGLAGLAERERSGRPGRLNEKQLTHVAAALRSSPARFGLVAEIWDGPTLSEFLSQELGAKLKVRQCQRLFRQIGFHLRKRDRKSRRANPQSRAAH